MRHALRGSKCPKSNVTPLLTGGYHVGELSLACSHNMRPNIMLCLQLLFVPSMCRSAAAACCCSSGVAWPAACGTQSHPLLLVSAGLLLPMVLDAAPSVALAQEVVSCWCAGAMMRR